MSNYGSVYIFNLYNDTANLTNLNGEGSVGQIVAPAKGSASPYWEPQQVSVARTNLTYDQLDSPLFINAHGDASKNTNLLTVNYGGQAWNAKIVIPDPPTPRLETDLWLYIAYQQAFLFDSSTGALIPQPSGPAIQLTEAD